MAAGLPRGRGTGQRPRTEREKLIGARVFTRLVALLTVFARAVDFGAEREDFALFCLVAIVL